MASAFTHAFVGTVIGKVFKEGKKMPARFWVGLAVCAALPDVDVVAFHWGIPYDSPWGHRGFTHSLVFAALLAWAALEVLRLEAKRFSKDWWLLWGCFFLATASHGLLDAMTTGGMGITFFWPFSNTRYFLPWRPILVSPIGVTRFWGQRAILILESEFLWVWLPTLLIYGVWKLIRPQQASKGSST